MDCAITPLKREVSGTNWFWLLNPNILAPHLRQQPGREDRRLDSSRWVAPASHRQVARRSPAAGIRCNPFEPIPSLESRVDDLVLENILTALPIKTKNVPAPDRLPAKVLFLVEVTPTKLRLRALGNLV